MTELPQNDPGIEQHNQAQIAYFSQTLKPTMIPQDSPYLNRMVDQVLAVLNPKPGERILEVGCGMGRYTLLLWKRGIPVEGLDLTPELLERLRAYGGSAVNYPLYCADILHPPAHLIGALDAVIGFFTLHHLHNLPLSFLAMASLLKPGGRILFVEPNAFNILYYLQILLTPRMTWAGDGGVAKMRPGVIFPAMKAAGFKQPMLRRFGFFPPFITNLPDGVWWEAQAERLFKWSPALPFQIFYGVKP